MEARSPISKQFEEIYTIIEKISKKTGRSIRATSEAVFEDYINQGKVDEDKIIQILDNQQAIDLLPQNFTKRSWMVVGETGMGKSTLVNQVFGKTVAKENRTSESQTTSVDIYSNQNIVVIDTPGLFDTRLEITNTKIMDEIISKIEDKMELDAKLDCIFLMWNPTASRKFRFEEIKSQLVKSFGDNILDSVVLLINKETKNWTDDHDFLISDLYEKKGFNLPIVIQDIKTLDLNEFETIQNGVKPYNEEKFKTFRKNVMFEYFLTAEEARRKKEDDEFIKNQIEEIKKQEKREYEEKLKQMEQEMQEKLRKQQEEADEKLRKHLLATEEVLKKQQAVFESKSKQQDNNEDDDDDEELKMYLEQIRQMEEREAQGKEYAKFTPSPHNQDQDDEELQKALREIERVEREELENRREQERLDREYRENELKRLQEERIQREKALEEEKKRVLEAQIAYEKSKIEEVKRLQEQNNSLFNSFSNQTQNNQGPAYYNNIRDVFSEFSKRP